MDETAVISALGYQGYGTAIMLGTGVSREKMETSSHLGTWRIREMGSNYVGTCVFEEMRHQSFWHRYIGRRE